MFQIKDLANCLSENYCIFSRYVPYTERYLALKKKNQSDASNGGNFCAETNSKTKPKNQNGKLKIRNQRNAEIHSGGKSQRKNHRNFFLFFKE